MLKSLSWDDENYYLITYKEKTEVAIQLKNELAGIIFDRFGYGVPISKTDENHFTCRVNVAVGPHFLTWIMSLGNGAKIISPEFVADKTYSLSKEISKMYKK